MNQSMTKVEGNEKRLRNLKKVLSMRFEPCAQKKAAKIKSRIASLGIEAGVCVSKRRAQLIELATSHQSKYKWHWSTEMQPTK